MVANLNADDLVVFYFVAREKSLSAAAEKLFLTQPAVTYRIKSLEEHIRVKLLDLKKRQVTLTPHGQELFKYAEEIYRQAAVYRKLFPFCSRGTARDYGRPGLKKH